MASNRPAEVGLTTATISAILNADTNETGRADQITGRLAQAIRLGLILDGERFPPEADLARRLGVAPVTLREALAILRERGLVVTRRGRDGGTFAHMPVDSDLSLPPPRLAEFSTHDLRELGDYRRAISGMAAYLAAERALPDEIEALDVQLERLRVAANPAERRRADAQLWVVIAAASQSARLTREEQQFRVEIGDLLWQPLSDDELAESIRSRQSLIAAISEHARQRARACVEASVLTETNRLLLLRVGLYKGENSGTATMGRDTQ
ncbi:FadR/GntR family transcriptional regulator [Rathayibacter soli]|uniref:FadR/GntR family transcriptional regulator n=1 Tax=Rathayibacter soli TaxID=3144168 RepID=UPI0027E4AC5C|nr:GntR family transcriptional regulator [Glaciibacter superstes]